MPQRSKEQRKIPHSVLTSDPLDSPVVILDDDRSLVGPSEGITSYALVSTHPGCAYISFLLP